MLKLEFQNAVVKDRGYGIEVNDNKLEDIISTALGTKRGGKRAGYGGELPPFESNSCDVTIIINPHKVTEHIETDSEVWESVKKLEEDTADEPRQKNGEADPKE